MRNPRGCLLVVMAGVGCWVALWYWLARVW